MKCVYHFKCVKMFKNNFLKKNLLNLNYSYWIFVPEVACASWIVGPSVTTLTLWMQNSATHDYCVLHAHSCTHTHKHTHTHWHPITERHEASHLLITGHMYDKQSRWTVAFSSLTGKKKSGADGWMVQLIGCCLLLSVFSFSVWHL